MATYPPPGFGAGEYPKVRVNGNGIVTLPKVRRFRNAHHPVLHK
jgi:hypothetical protein